MTATTLDPRTALVVIDLQQGIVGLPTAHPAKEVVARSAELAAAFRERGLPVVLVNVSGMAPGRTESPMRGSLPEGWDLLVPELNRQPGDIAVTKLQWGAFHGTALDLELRRRGVTQIVLTGISTSIGVESTARSAYEHGYNVTVVTDAVTDTDAEAHANSVAKIFPRLGETGSAADVLALLPAATA
ncbi:isochorismatase family protein [Actinacidiphila acididurans]|uniref:Isochorismatase family protein n=1 Tax=Actinacidiphila acididurans TaxID=2784346 RepID=A0ABS2TUL1_9ACTN|nr:isochorismatase family protein [Actinacidiphila acididurans]MBM9507024.1 isochorismatase family protein [Actinacidiphila acididurans]